MPTLKNTYMSDLILPNGIAIRRNGPAVPIADDIWKKMLAHPVVKAWVDERRIEVVKGKPEADDGNGGDEALKALRNEAEALGIKVDARWKEPRLTKEIEEAKARDTKPGDDKSDESGESKSDSADDGDKSDGESDSKGSAE